MSKEEKPNEYPIVAPGPNLGGNFLESLSKIEVLEVGYQAGREAERKEIIEKLEKRYLEISDSGYDGLRVTGWRDSIDYLIENLSK